MAFIGRPGLAAAALERLEPRRLFAGGIDPTFGSSTGAELGLPPVLADARIASRPTVDRAGRVLLCGGTTNDNLGDMIIIRLRTDGQPDPKFGDGGILRGTPRGMHHAQFVLPLPEGGYIVANDGRLIRLKPNGRLDTSFGINGVAHVTLVLNEVLRQSDGKLLLVGFAQPRDRDITDADYQNYAVRLTADGRLDRSYGESGWATIGDELFTDGIRSIDDFITSAVLDSQDRLLLGFAGTRENFSESDFEGFIDGMESYYVKRLTAGGAIDTSFGDSDNDNRSMIFSRTFTDNPEGQPNENGALLLEPDGRIRVIHQNSSTLSPQPAFVREMDSDGSVASTNVQLQNLASSFNPNLSAVVLRDGSIVLSGQRISGQTKTPVLIHLRSDLAIDTQFGTSGLMLIPSTGGRSDDVGQIALDPDGTITAYLQDRATVDDFAGADSATRFFVNDQPVVSLLRSRRLGDELQVTVSVRGAHAIDSLSLDDNDLRLVSGSGARTKLRLKHFSQSEGVITATYRVAAGLLPPGVFGVRAIAGQLADVDGNRNSPIKLGEVVIA